MLQRVPHILPPRPFGNLRKNRHFQMTPVSDCSKQLSSRNLLTKHSETSPTHALVFVLKCAIRTLEKAARSGKCQGLRGKRGPAFCSMVSVKRYC